MTMIFPKALFMTAIAAILIFSMASISYQQQVELPFDDNGEAAVEEEGEAAEAEEAEAAVEEEAEAAVEEEGEAAACIDYEAAENTIAINCNASFLDVVRAINDPEILEQEDNGQYILNANLEVGDGITFKMNSSGDNLQYLKISGENGIIVQGRIEISGIKITSWDSETDSPISQTQTGSVPRTFINLRVIEGGFIENSEVAYIGYDAPPRRGIDLGEAGEGPSHDFAIIADLRLDTTTLTAALLHDTVEDTEVGLGDIEREFGNEVARIVDGLTKLDKLEFRSGELAQAENVRKMIVAMAGDIRVLLVKLADRLHNMRTLAPLSEERRHKIANETLEIHAPLADRLGVQEMKWELEDLAFKTLNPGPYREIANLVETRRGERQQLLEGVKGSLRAKLKELGVKADVEGRPKHLYSIYEKMVIRGKEFNEIHDLVGLRVLVDSLRDCYGALGAVHALWKPIPGRFKDYIAMPKSNMYQSLHTTVVGPKGLPLEIQIRTRDMHRTAQFGIAAHWRYKEGASPRRKPQDMAWLGQMMEWLKDMADPQEFMEGLRIDLSGGRVFVLHAQGRRAEPPAGRDARRLRVLDPHRGRPPHDRGQGERQARAARTTSSGPGTRSRS